MTMLGSVNSIQNHQVSNSKDNLSQLLHKAIADGDEGQIQQLIKEGADVNAPDKTPKEQGGKGDRPLNAAAENKSESAVKTLLKAGAEVNGKNHNQCTALHQGAKEGSPEVVAALVAAGADTDVINMYNKTASDKAREKGHELIAVSIDEVEETKKMEKTKRNKKTMNAEQKMNDSLRMSILGHQVEEIIVELDENEDDPIR